MPDSDIILNVNFDQGVYQSIKLALLLFFPGLKVIYFSDECFLTPLCLPNPCLCRLSWLEYVLLHFQVPFLCLDLFLFHSSLQWFWGAHLTSGWWGEQTLSCPTVFQLHGHAPQSSRLWDSRHLAILPLGYSQSVLWVQLVQRSLLETQPPSVSYIATVLPP